MLGGDGSCFNPLAEDIYSYSEVGVALFIGLEWPSEVNAPP
jgi:hypothetical protein